MSSFNRLFYHCIWATKNREYLINDEIEKILLDYLPKKIKKLGGICHQLEIVPDHIHLAVSVSPNISLTCFVKSVKGSSSHLINNSFPNQYFNWQTGYGIVSFHEKLLPIIKKYIANQKQHHKNNTLVDILETRDKQPTSVGLV